MTQLQTKMLLEAIKKYGKIYPTGSEKYLKNCFMLDNGYLQFWFNDKDGSTHLLRTKTKSQRKKQ